MSKMCVSNYTLCFIGNNFSGYAELIIFMQGILILALAYMSLFLLKRYVCLTDSI